VTGPVRIGIFGGTFDPVHFGHLRAADAVRRCLRLDRMLLVVANDPWQKDTGRPVSPAEDRYAMVVAAAREFPGLEPSRLEIDRGGPSYTIDTVRELRASDATAELVLVVGADIVPELPTWHDAETLRDAVLVAVVGRPGARVRTPPEGWRFVSVPVEPFDVSSTDLRRRVANREPLVGLVPAEVIRCIERSSLYVAGG
jgi:nicotinate-nucleotide adenylyltransferase